MTPQEFKTLLDKYSRGECTPQEEEFVLTWYENIGQNHDREIKEEFRILMEAKIWTNLKTRNQKSRTIPFRFSQKIAASLALLILAGVGIFFSIQYYQKALPDSITEGSVLSGQAGEMVVMTNVNTIPQVVKLSDGSEVTLQPQSEIKFPQTFGENRVVYLKGEAFFDVRRDSRHPFLVYSNEVVTRVLGTSFTIKAYSESKNITVAVKSGRVSVYKNSKNIQPGEKDEVILAPNQQAIYDRTQDKVSRQLVSKPEIVQKNPSPLDMQYDEAQVVSVFRALEELYGIDIEFDENTLSNCTITTSLEEEGLFERVKVICEAIGAHYEVQDTVILISSHGCN